MKYLQILNAVALAFGAAMGLILAVVCIMYLANAAETPRLMSDVPPLLLLTGLFLSLSAAGGAAFIAHRRGWPGRWLIQGLPLAPVAGLGAFLLSLKA